MIGAGLNKLAKQHGMQISGGVASGSLMGFAATLSEGAGGYKRIDVSTKFPTTEQKGAFLNAVEAVDTVRTYRLQDLGISAYGISVVFQDTVGTMKRIEAFIDWFFPLLRQHGAAGADVCAECGGQLTEEGWYLINGVAHHLHESCAQRVREELQSIDQQRRDGDTGSYVQGFLGALIGAALGAAVWALVLYLGYLAAPVGLLIGWLAEKGYNLMHGRQGKGKVVILIIAILFGVLLGTIAPDVVVLAQMIGNGELPGFTYAEIPYIIITMLLQDEAYLGATASNTLMGLLFAALGVFALLRKVGKEVADATFKKLR